MIMYNIRLNDMNILQRAAVVIPVDYMDRKDANPHLHYLHILLVQSVVVAREIPGIAIMNSASRKCKREAGWLSLSTSLASRTAKYQQVILLYRSIYELLRSSI